MSDAARLYIAQVRDAALAIYQLYTEAGLSNLQIRLALDLAQECRRTEMTSEQALDAKKVLWEHYDRLQKIEDFLFSGNAVAQTDIESKFKNGNPVPRVNTSE